MAAKITENNTVYSAKELHLWLFLSSAKVILGSFTPSTFTVHSSAELCSVELRSTNLSTNFFLRLQYFWSKYLPTWHDLLHSRSQSLGFQINPLLHTPLSKNCLHSQLHLSLFQRYLLLQTLGSNPHLHLHVSSFIKLFVVKKYRAKKPRQKLSD